MHYQLWHDSTYWYITVLRVTQLKVTEKIYCLYISKNLDESYPTDVIEHLHPTWEKV